ncbi:hypothetical protein AAHH67_00120 [Niallia circulans]|uniref:hypothetical protein n=1 Tax=Niallia circulans TaxID=1397 RepID=UPI00069F3C1F|nr:hypothetical protein [Niallia circulans]MED5102853.1 hypothetical protein [Niallia circulans]
MLQKEKAKVGNALVTVDLDMIRKRAKRTVIPIINVNINEMLNIDKPLLSGKITIAKETILAVTVNSHF